MTTRKTSIVERLIASSAAAALLITAPGLPVYQAAAQVFNGSSVAGNGASAAGRGGIVGTGGFQNQVSGDRNLEGGYESSASFADGVPQAGGGSAKAAAAVAVQTGAGVAAVGQAAPSARNDASVSRTGAASAVESTEAPAVSPLATAVSEDRQGKPSILSSAASRVGARIDQLKKYFGKKSIVDESGALPIETEGEKASPLEKDLKGRDADYRAGYAAAKDWVAGSDKEIALPEARPWMSGLTSQKVKLEKRKQSFYQGMAHGIAARTGDEGSIPEFFKALGRGETLGAVLNSFFPAAPADGPPQPFVEKAAAASSDGGNGGDGKAPSKDYKLPRSLWGLVIGHHILIILGLNLHVYSQAGLVENLTGSRAMVGVVRNVHFGSYTAASFLPIGPTIQKTDFKYLFMGTSIMRALLMGAIPLLWMSGHLVLGALILIVAINPMFQNMMTTSDASATDVYLGKDEKDITAGNAKLTKIDAVTNILIPFIAGTIVSMLTAHFGMLGGYAMAYAGYAIMLLVAVPVFHFMVNDPRHDDPDLKVKPVKGFWPNVANIFLPAWTAISNVPVAVWFGLKGVSLVLGTTEAVRVGLDVLKAFLSSNGMAFNAAFTVLWAVTTPVWVPVMTVVVQVGRGLKFLRAIRDAVRKAGQPKKPEDGEKGEKITAREKLARLFEQWPSVAGVATILRSNTLSILVGVAGIEMFLADAMTFIVLRNYIADVIHPRLDLIDIPFIGKLLGTEAGVLTLMFSAMNVARFLASSWVDGEKGQKRLAKYGHPVFYKVAALSSVAFAAMLIPLMWMPEQGVQDLIHQGYKLMGDNATREAGKELILKGLGSIPLWQFWSTMGIFVGVQFVSALFHTPLAVAIRAVKRKQIPDDQIGPVNAGFQMIDVALMAVGALTVGVLMDMLSVTTGLYVVTGAVMGTAAMTWMAQKWLSKVNPEGWKQGDKKEDKKP